ncbi:beta-galactosidase [Actinoplanes sp. NPDC048988]|uniref:beta-galactosidase n=1 Tax=Actinoplanes sp. NPDC048988 TaxID=3363901 RepID=UPI00371AF2CB
MTLAAVLSIVSLVVGNGDAAAAGAATASLGIIGNYSDADMRSMRSAGGAGDALVEMNWSQAEPAPGQFDVRYLDSVAARAATLRAMGYTISLNTGIQSAPAWLLARPGARYVDQNGVTYTGGREPNLVFGTAYRPLAVRYLTRVFQQLGTDFSLVRAGGGHWGELTYPSSEKQRNLYFAFDVNAARLNPVPGWKPGQPSRAGQAAKFLNWYLNALAGYQNWQITALRQAGWAGTVAMLYPSYGMRAGDFDKAVATNLSGTSSAEINGEVQRGYDATRQIGALKDKKVAVYGTWAENADTVAYLAGLARGKGLPVMAETTHVCRPSQLPAVMGIARANGLAALYIVRLGAADIVGNASYLRTA